MAEIRKKEFTFRGKTSDELKAMDVREFAKLLRSRQRRTVLRQFQKIEDFVNRAKKKQSNKRPIKTHHRDLIVVPQMIGMKIQIYNGKEFVSTDIREEMLGHVFGEFAPTRTRVKHGTAGVGATKGTRAKSKH